jgi:sulfate adenylyltransferase large subunit
MDSPNARDEQSLIETDIIGYLEQHQRKELCRFTTVGSVDDGKSTLIGRLLFDAHGLYEDQLRAVERASSQKSDALDLSLVTDGLRAEREQGITIDVAYRYFSTDKRKFIIADTPGHVQYTRNMATGASTANVAIILIDARLGVLQQSRRHAYIASLLGIPHLAACVNKMDLVGYDRSVFERIRAEFAAFASRLGVKEVTYIPISALKGDNVVHRSEATPWHDGPTLLAHLETVPVARDRNHENFRYPVQYVLRPHLDYRGFAGEIAAGVVRKGDPILVLPSRKTTRVRAIDTYGGEIEAAFAPMSVTIRLEDEVDVSRGDMLVHPDDLPEVGQGFDAMIVWMSERPLDRDKTYFLKHTTQLVRAEVVDVVGHTDLETLEEVSAAGLGLNDIGRVRIRCHRPIFFDAYAKSRATGAFILIDSMTNGTVAAGMILGATSQKTQRSTELSGPRTQVSAGERRERLGQTGALVRVRGDAADVVGNVAYALERRLFDLGRVAAVVHPNDGLSGGETGRPPSVDVARRLARAGLIAIFVEPASGAAAGEPGAGLPEPFIDVSVARGGDDRGAADVTVSSDALDPEKSAEAVIRVLEARKVFGASG